MFQSPLGLLALLGVPAVVLLHLFRRRFERRPVSALFLWEAAREEGSLEWRSHVQVGWSLPFELGSVHCVYVCMRIVME